VAVSVVLLGCGSTSVRPPTRSGRALFAEDCTKCHSLIGNESLRRAGGDLLGYRLNHRALMQFVSEMPVRRPLTPAQIAAIVEYVSAKERTAGGR
jgi:mono/diheme cytochrome c family protein